MNDTVTRTIARVKIQDVTHKLKGSQPKQEIWLVCYDTAYAELIRQEQLNCRGHPRIAPELPAKWLLFAYMRKPGLFSNPTDMICQEERYKVGQLHQVWFDYWELLPEAIKKLQEQNPELELRPEVDYVVDWPLMRCSPNEREAAAEKAANLPTYLPSKT